jgi:hypothetical protein
MQIAWDKWAQGPEKGAKALMASTVGLDPRPCNENDGDRIMFEMLAKALGYPKDLWDAEWDSCAKRNEALVDTGGQEIMQQGAAATTAHDRSSAPKEDATEKQESASTQAPSAVPPVGETMRYCSACGRVQLTDDATICMHCGYSIVPKVAVESRETAVKPQLEGIHGWLWLLCFSLTVGGPISCLIEILREQTPYAIILYGLWGGCSFATGYRLCKKRRGAVRFAKKYFISVGILCALLLALSIVASGNASAEQQYEGTQAALHAFFAPMIASIIWFLYLRNSYRIAATYKCL